MHLICTLSKEAKGRRQESRFVGLCSTNVLFSLILGNNAAIACLFIWIDGGLKITGTTPTGRATCSRMDFNDEFHNQGFIQESRQLWMQGG